jgi:hypothetical protein
VDGNNRVARGAISGGEFGRRLADIFAPQSHAEFSWKGWSRVRKQRVAVFTYRVDQEHSLNRISHGEASAAKVITAGFHFEISVDPETGAALRVTLTAELSHHRVLVVDRVRLSRGCRTQISGPG